VHQWAQTLESQKGAAEEFTKAVAALDQLVARRAGVLTLAARRVQENSSQMLKAKYKSDPHPEQHINALEKLMAGARVHDAHDKCVERVSAMAKHDAEMPWSAFRRELLDIYKTKIAAGAGPDPSTELADRIRALIFTESILTPQQAQKIYQTLSDDNVGDVFAAVPDDYIALTYIDRDRDVDFQKASPGQQASALLELLLRQSAGTLIIDQPEDDLDNRVIMQIVNRIRDSKSMRQLLFTTHNPNIVVNGDADKVIVLQSSDTSAEVPREIIVGVEVDGAIETPDVRKAIAAIMEGGKEAFDLRSRKYRFDR
jgi:putative AbiEii toxin of type IV toxin-antitoxin system